MELRHLRYFMAAAEEEHFGRAADRLHVTRPAVSQIIATLESEIGTPLFERLTHRVRLTAAGRVLLPRLQVVMDEINDAFAVAKRAGEGKSGALNIGYGSLTLLHSLFRATIKQFHESYPDVALSLCEIPTWAQPKALAEGKIHAGFMHFGPHPAPQQSKHSELALRPEQKALDYLRIQTSALGVLLASDHPLASKRELRLAELAREPFVVVPHSSSSPSYGQLYTLCQKAGFEPRIVQEVSTITSQLNLISVGMGIGFAVIGKNFSYPPSLAVLPLHDVHYTTSFVLGWIKGHKDPALERMIEIVSTLARLD